MRRSNATLTVSTSPAVQGNQEVKPEAESKPDTEAKPRARKVGI